MNERTTYAGPEMTQARDCPRMDATERLGGLTDELLRRALRTADVADAADRELSEPLMRVCAEARARGLRAEELLLAIKASWRHLPEARRRHRDDIDELFARVITLCIREYYRAARQQS